MKHCYRVDWSYKDDIGVHTTVVECQYKRVQSALDRFKRFYSSTLHRWDSNRPSFDVVSVTYLGIVINKCW